MLQTMRNAWKIDDLRHKILFTLVIILLYRLGNAVPVPYVNIDALNGYFAQMQNTVLGLLNVMSGGAFSNATIFALSIQPYINASIIIQLLCIAIPSLERLQEEDRLHHSLHHRSNRPDPGLCLLLHDHEVRLPDR